MENNGYFRLEDTDLYKYNTMRVHAVAHRFFLPYTEDGLISLCEEYYGNGDFLIVGKGSNMIFSEEYYQRPVILTEMMNAVDFSSGCIAAQCGTALSTLAWFAQEKGIAGFEFLEDIPGSVGGALFMNAGTFEGTISELVSSVTVYDFAEHRRITLSASELEPYWGKRKSYFQDAECCILNCCFKADNKGDRTEILEKMLDTKKARYAKQPREYPSAGSVFKRPQKNGEPVYVWKLLDEAGLRGYRIGGAMISDKHPGFIVNCGGATGKDLVELLNCCKLKVKELFDVELEEEWRII